MSDSIWSRIGALGERLRERVGRSAGTVSDYLAAVVDEYGACAACARAASDLGVRAALGDADLGREVTA